MKKAPLTFLAYLSHIRCTPEEIAEVVRKARSRNAASGVTGVLMHDRTHFLQLLEGPWQATAETLLRIVGDPRHSDVRVLLREPTEVRQFSNWNLERLEVPGGDAILSEGMSAVLALPHRERGPWLREFALKLERPPSPE